VTMPCFLDPWFRVSCELIRCIAAC
jgi:hypothetical protein